MKSTQQAGFLFILLMQSSLKVEGLLKITGLNCEVIDKDFADLVLCKLNSLSNTQNTASFEFVLKQDYNTSKIHFILRRKTNVWRTHYLDTYIDSCDFLRNAKKYPLLQGLHKFINNYTNYNHTCPYKAGERFILDSLEVKEFDFIQLFPLRNGEYAAHTEWYMKDKLRFKINITCHYAN